MQLHIPPDFKLRTAQGRLQKLKSDLKIKNLKFWDVYKMDPDEVCLFSLEQMQKMERIQPDDEDNAV